tara:strand:- start:1406 stop:2179 length:774 start_codon:yes stop_codon:yes gene_type:complete
MMNQEPDFGSLMPDTFADLGNTSYGAAIDDYQAQMDDFDLKGPNAQFIASNASYDEESSQGGANLGPALAAALAENDCLKDTLKPPDSSGLPAGAGCWRYQSGFKKYNTTNCPANPPFVGYYETFGADGQVCVTPGSTAGKYTVTVTNVGYYLSDCPVSTGSGALITFQFLGDNGASINFSAQASQTRVYTGVSLFGSVTYSVRGSVYSGVGTPVYVPVGKFSPNSSGSGVEDVTHKAYVDVDADGNPINPDGSKAC